MPALTLPLADLLPSPTDFLSVGKAMGTEITLTIGPVYTTGFLVAGPLLILAAVILVSVMYGRVKYFALEYGYGTGWGRVKAVLHYIVIGLLMAGGGLLLSLIGWGNLGYSVILSTNGLTEIQRAGTNNFRWDDLKAASERIKSTDFWLTFEANGKKCRVQFQQQNLGESIQDQAIKITEEAIRTHPGTGITL
ncbi:MAG: hypothetical protein RIS79_3664 [Verrucomicrobiota bacterium]|jgi:hypothetical protein